jgi:excisionase family DNA binding protein
MTVAELAQRWRCSTKTVRRYMEAGSISYTQISRNHRLISIEAVEEYEARMTSRARGSHHRRKAA